MTVRTAPGAAPTHQNQTWYDEFGLIPRFPRPPAEDIKKLLNDIQEPTIFLREHKQSVDVVVRLPVPYRVFSPVRRKRLSQSGLTLSRAFEDILWQKYEETTFWSEFAGLHAKAFRRAWIHLFDLCYLGHFHPAADARLKEIKEGISSAQDGVKVGRPPSRRAETQSLRRRYEELLPKCKLIHDAARRVVASLDKGSENRDFRTTRKAIWEEVRTVIHGMPGDGYIFGGAAFKNISYRNGKAQLHDPNTWKPHQLAISLLSFDRMQAYETIEKKIRPTLTKKSRSIGPRN
jgi:hypothetical protein